MSFDTPANIRWICFITKNLCKIQINISNWIADYFSYKIFITNVVYHFSERRPTQEPANAERIVDLRLLDKILDYIYFQNRFTKTFLISIFGNSTLIYFVTPDITYCQSVHLYFYILCFYWIFIMCEETPAYEREHFKKAQFI